jgi:hypothetical protein
MVCYLAYYDRRDLPMPEFPLGPFAVGVATLYVCAGTIQGLWRRHLSIWKYLPLVALIASIFAAVWVLILRATTRPPLIAIAIISSIVIFLSLRTIDWLVKRR